MYPMIDELLELTHCSCQNEYICNLLRFWQLWLLFCNYAFSAVLIATLIRQVSLSLMGHVNEAIINLQN